MLQDSFARRYRVNAVVQATGEQTDTLVITGMRNCGPHLQALVEGLGSDDYNSSARVMCTAYGFRRISCETRSGEARVVDLNRDCVCTSKWDCVCPRP
jgi:hypothetical protein